ncbi:MAG TPA: aminotransferase class V-fold PLP-dependent enzyme [Solirubrobacteraceae bacterium]|nr:aminotransferase class V-fold PLP-dependent enzyme [Solirubrobacteraceae bacterium]
MSLELPPEEMRRLGYRVIDRIVEHWSSLDAAPTVAIGDPAALRELLSGPPPDGPGDASAALDRLFDDVLPWTATNVHPRWFARISSPSNYVSALADAVSSGFNLLGTSWVASSGPSTVELTVLDWLRSWCGMPEGSEGLLTSGGSMASLTALVAAREARGGGGVVYLSDQAHGSILRDLKVMGEREVRVLRSDERFRLPVAAVAAAVADDRAAGRVPFAVVANAGTTNTGAVDPLPELADLCAEERLWFHVDGAYGAAAVLTEGGRATLAGMGRADSLVIDPHKWLFQPYEVGAVLVREPGLLERTFTLSGEYLRDTFGGEVNFRDRGIQLTRGTRALKLWLSVQVFGLDAFRDAVAHGIALAEHAEAVLRERPGWQVVTPAQLGLVCFTRGDDDSRISAATVLDGYAAPSTTVLRGQTVLRLCTINPRTTFEEIERTIERMERV